MSIFTTRWPLGRRWTASFGALLCLLLIVLLSGYDSIHIHSAAGGPQDGPSAPHHCLLCLAGHLPVTVQDTVTVAVARCVHAAALIADKPGLYESASTFPFYTRPPPQA